MKPLPCRLVVPDSFQPRARYALAMLLRPLGIDPAWTDAASPEEPRLYYGPARRPAPGQISLVHDPDAPRYFGSRRPYAPERVRWLRDGPSRWPLLFGSPEAPDWIASTFFWLSGWQERTIPARDRHGRFLYRDSLQRLWGTAARPAVDFYRARLVDQIAAAGVRLPPPSGWDLVPTHDIDYLSKRRPGLLYQAVRDAAARGAAGRERLGGYLRQVVSTGDPYEEGAHRLLREATRRGGRSTFFLKAGATGPYDVPYALESPKAQRLIRAILDAGCEIGLHPSYHAATRPEVLRAERERLEAAVGRSLECVRQHYLRFALGTTDRAQARAGFRLDATLGFPDHEGFRHATCHPFRLYDPEREQASSVWEVPLALMDAALFTRRELDLHAALRATDPLLEACARFGGVAVGLWHNTAWDPLDDPGSGRHFLRTLDRARAAGARIASLRQVAAQRQL